MIRFLQTPGKTKKIVLGGLLVVICGAMVITLVPGGMLGDAFGFGQPEQGVLAKIGDQSVTMVDVQQTANQMGRQQFPKGFPQEFMPFLMQRAADMLITQKALINQAQTMGFRVSDAELRDELQNGPFGPQLFPGGNFIGEDQYENFVQNYFQLSVPQFEQRMKDDILIKKLQAAVEGGASVTPDEIKQEYQRENTKVKFDYAVLNEDDIMKQIHPSQDVLKSFYDSHKQQYVNSIPEKRKASYVVVDKAKVEQSLQVTPQELQQYYQAHQDEYRVPEQVKVAHILIKTPPPGANGKVDQKAVDAARAKAEDILKQVQAGGNFAELAKKNSDDPGSKDQGGELGWIRRQQTVPEFEKAAFSLAKGQTSGLVQSTFGFHIIRVEDKQDAHLKPLEEVKPQIEGAIRAQKVSQKLQDLTNAVVTEARLAGLHKAAQDHGLQAVDSNLFARTDSLPGVGAAPEFMSAVFGAKVNSAPDSVSVPQGDVVYTVTQIVPAATPTFEQIKAKVEQDYKQQQAGALLAQKIDQLDQKAKEDHDLAKAAKEFGATVKTSDMLGPTGQVPELGAMSGPASVAFDLKPGEISGPISAGRTAAVIKVVDRQEPPPAAFAAAQDRLRDTLLQQKRAQMFELFAANLRTQLEKESKIRINQDEMKRLTQRNTPGE